jgi:hypothetical protein
VLPVHSILLQGKDPPASVFSSGIKRKTSALDLDVRKLVTPRSSALLIRSLKVLLEMILQKF